MNSPPVWLRILPPFLRARVDGRRNLQQIISNLSWLLIDKVVRIGLGLFVSFWIARYLGAELFGRFNYALAFVMLFGSLATLGLDTIVVRNIVRTPDQADEILGTAFWLKAVAAVLTCLLTVVLIALLRPDDMLVIVMVAIIAGGNIFQAFTTIELWFQANMESRSMVYARNAAFLGLTLIKIGLIVIQAPLVAFAWASAAEVALGAICLVVAYRLRGEALQRWRYSHTQARQLLADSWPLILSGLMVTVYMRIDQVMLGQMIGDTEVGIYSAAVRLAEFWYFLPVVIVTAVFPNIVAVKDISEDLFYARLQRLYNLVVLIGYAVALPTTLFANWVVVLFFGEAYLSAGPMLAVLIWTSIFTGLGVARSSFLTTMNWTKLHFFTVFAGCLINIGLNLLLIPAYGGLGAAIASCVAYWFAAHGACFFYSPLVRTGMMMTRALFYPKVW